MRGRRRGAGGVQRKVCEGKWEKPFVILLKNQKSKKQLNFMKFTGNEEISSKGKKLILFIRFPAPSSFIY